MLEKGKVMNPNYVDYKIPTAYDMPEIKVTLVAVSYTHLDVYKRQRIMVEITFTINGEKMTKSVDPNKTLLHYIREDLDLTGTKEGCGAGECGACTILVDGKPVNSCLMLAVEADGKEILTLSLIHI